MTEPQFPSIQNAKKRVFISYSWESDAFKADVWSLAGWLQTSSNNQVEVITDHLFSVVPPPEGWYRWMRNEIAKADVVFSICTPKYKRYFEGVEYVAVEGGYGVTHEGLIITSHFYEGKGHNKKFFPIYPDDGNVNNIPDILKTYNNDLKFPSGCQRILELVIGKNPSHPGNEMNKIELIDATETINIIELEKEIVEEIEMSAHKKDDNMSFDLQILIRAYLALSDVEKSNVIRIIAKGFKVDVEDPDERDKLFLIYIHNNGLLPDLWEAINRINLFENPANPF